MNRFLGVACIVLFTSGCPVLAQTQPVLVSEDKAYFFGERDRIVPTKVLSTSVSPDGKYLLATHLSPHTETFQSVLTLPDLTQTATVILTLYDTRRDRSTALWKASGDRMQSTVPLGISWLSSQETVIVPLLHTKQIVLPGDAESSQSEYAVSLLYINALRQTVRQLSLGGTSSRFQNFNLSPSPTRNEALVTSAADDNSYELRFLTGTGTLQPPVSVPARSLTVKGWSADGERAEVRAATIDKENKRVVLTYLWERQTRTLRRVATPDKDTNYRADDDATDTKRRADLPFRIGARKAVVTVEQTKHESPCVLAQGKDGKEQYILATDANPITILESGTRLTAVYETDSALYAVPVYPVGYSEYVTFMRRGVESNAKQIDSAMEQWMLDNKVESFPRSFDPIAELVGDGKSLYMRRDTAFRDPKTGAMMFRSIYTGKPDVTGNIPRFALQSPFGKLTMYEGGKNPIVWDPVEPPAKP